MEAPRQRQRRRQLVCLICLKNCENCVLHLFQHLLNIVQLFSPNLFQQFSYCWSPNLLNLMLNSFEICQMVEVGGFLPGGRLELRRSPRQIFLQSRRKYRRIWAWGAPTSGDALIALAAPKSLSGSLTP